MYALQRYGFPGNVRELENILERAFTLCENATIQADDLQLGGAAMETSGEHPSVGVSPTPAASGDEYEDAPAPSPQAEETALPMALAPGQSLEDYLETVERKLIVDALEATRWNKTAAAKALGITFRALRYRLKKLELE